MPRSVICWPIKKAVKSLKYWRAEKGAHGPDMLQERRECLEASVKRF
jgi:hypothetical protein